MKMRTPMDKHRQDASIRIRLLKEQEELFRKAAVKSGLSLSAWVRDRLLKIARKEVGRIRPRSVIGRRIVVSRAMIKKAKER